MNEDQQTTLTNGNLPSVAFRHLEPTGVGIVDLDRSIMPRTPDGRGWNAEQRDGLLLIRLHDAPIALVHIEKSLRDATSEELAAEIWRSAGSEIRQHIERFRCAQMPTSPDAILSGLDSGITVCSGGRPSQTKASVSVILCTLGQEERLKRCLPSLLNQSRSDLELLVVDNRPDSGEALRTVSAIAAEDPRVRYVAEPRLGLSVARNRGVIETSADIVAFTDDDVVVDPGWLEWLVAPFAETRVTAACGMVLPLELESEAQKRFEQYGGFSKGLQQRAFDLQSGRETRPLLYPFLGDLFGGGNSMAFRRRELLDAGGFDPALGAGSPTGGGEDIYALSTAVLRGGRVVYEPRSLCWHEHRKDDAGLHGQVFSYGIGLGAVLTKALTSDPRFFVAAARSVPILLRSRRSSPDSTNELETPAAENAATSRAELLRAHRRGILRGPVKYAEGVVRARKLGL
jgi:O-antigen biosynthesis protein